MNYLEALKELYKDQDTIEAIRIMHLISQIECKELKLERYHETLFGLTNKSRTLIRELIQNINAVDIQIYGAE